jgi:dTDP-4-amino-4,6-dideoxygalactose transaminase
LQAAVLRVKLKHLETWHAMRRANGAYYDAHFKSTAIELPHLAYGREHHIYNQYIVRIPGRRDEAKAHLTANDIGCDIYYPIPFHMQECFQYLGYKEGQFPHSELAAKETLALPIYSELTDAMQDCVIGALEGFLG